MNGRCGRKEGRSAKRRSGLKMFAVNYSSLYRDLCMGSYISGVCSVRFCVGKYSTSALQKSATKEVRTLGIRFREGFPV
jgi:hypothetical protein